MQDFILSTVGRLAVVQVSTLHLRLPGIQTDGIETPGPQVANEEGRRAGFRA